MKTFSEKGFSLRNISDEIRNPRIKIKATIGIQIKHDLIHEDYEKEFVVNSLPDEKSEGGGCSVTPDDGFVVETLFNITCVGWNDEDKPLKYEYHYNTSAGIVINYPKAINNMLSTHLPAGDRAKDFELLVGIIVQDKLGDKRTSKIRVKVRQ